MPTIVSRAALFIIPVRHHFPPLPNLFSWLFPLILVMNYVIKLIMIVMFVTKATLLVKRERERDREREEIDR